MLFGKLLYGGVRATIAKKHKTWCQLVFNVSWRLTMPSSPPSPVVFISSAATSAMSVFDAACLSHSRAGWYSAHDPYFLTAATVCHSKNRKQGRTYLPLRYQPPRHPFPGSIYPLRQWMWPPCLTLVAPFILQRSEPVCVSHSHTIADRTRQRSRKIYFTNTRCVT